MVGLNRRGLLARFALLGAGTLLAACTPAPGAVIPTLSSATGPNPTSDAAASAANPQSTTSGRTTTVVYAVSSNPATLNPLLDDSGASQSGYELLFEGLVKPDPKTGTPIPSLATSWDQSEDGLKWTFHIRPSVTWHDGQPFGAEDVKFTFDAIQDPKTRTPYRNRFSNVASVDAPDKSTFNVTLKVPDCPFLITTMQTPIVPKHLLAASA